jgi:dienelactone hydrolase
LIDNRGALAEDRREKLNADALDLIATKGFRAVVAFYPLCKAVAGRLVIPTLILIGALDDWTPAADCSEKIVAWRTDGVPIEQVVYPNVHHSFYYPELQPGRTIFGHWLEYNEEAATNATRRMREFLKRHLN